MTCCQTFNFLSMVNLIGADAERGAGLEDGTRNCAAMGRTWIEMLGIKQECVVICPYRNPLANDRVDASL